MSPQTIDTNWIDHIDANTSFAKHQKKWLLDSYELKCAGSLFAMQWYMHAMIRDDQLQDLVLDNIDDDSRNQALMESLSTDKEAYIKLVCRNVESIMLTNIKEVKSLRESFDESMKGK